MKILPLIHRAPVAPLAPREDKQIRVGQLNAYNLFDTVDDSSTQDPVLERKAYTQHLGKLAIAIRDSMGAPDVITLQEVENLKVLRDLAGRPELAKFGYKALLVEGTDPRGIDNAILYRDTVKLLETGQLDPVNVTDAGRGVHLFTRPPLVARFGINGRENARKGIKELTVVAAHLTSKLGQEKAAAKRALQAEVLAEFAIGQAANDAKRAVIISGDYNMEYDEPEFAPLRKLKKDDALVDLAQQVPGRQRFSWRDGRKHLLLDHMLASPALASSVVDVHMARIGTQIEKGAASDPVRAEGVTDHDPMVATFQLG